MCLCATFVCLCVWGADVEEVVWGVKPSVRFFDLCGETHEAFARLRRRALKNVLVECHRGSRRERWDKWASNRFSSGLHYSWSNSCTFKGHFQKLFSKTVQHLIADPLEFYYAINIYNYVSKTQSFIPKMESHLAIFRVNSFSSAFKHLN